MRPRCRRGGERGAEVQDLRLLRDSRERTLRLERLPSLPTVAHRLLELLSGEPEIHELEEILHHDPSLTAKILSVANSAYTGVHQEIDTLQRAIVVLGVREVSEIAFSICVASLLSPLRAPDRFPVRSFWLHSVATGVTAKILAQSLDLADEELFFTLGLLHDIGRLVLMRTFPQEFEEILTRQARSGRELLIEEREAALAHTWLGRWLVRHWGLPRVFETVVRFHHHPYDRGRFLPEAAVVGLADRTVHALGLVPLPGGAGDRTASLVERLGLEDRAYQAIREHLREVLDGLVGGWGAFLAGATP